MDSAKELFAKMFFPLDMEIAFVLRTCILVLPSSFAIRPLCVFLSSGSCWTVILLIMGSSALRCCNYTVISAWFDFMNVSVISVRVFVSHISPVDAPIASLMSQRFLQLASWNDLLWTELDMSGEFRRPALWPRTRCLKWRRCDTGIPSSPMQLSPKIFEYVCISSHRYVFPDASVSSPSIIRSRTEEKSQKPIQQAAIF